MAELKKQSFAWLIKPMGLLTSAVLLSLICVLLSGVILFSWKLLSATLITEFMVVSFFVGFPLKPDLLGLPLRFGVNHD